jgi:hypothetical protein
MSLNYFNNMQQNPGFGCEIQKKINLDPGSLGVKKGLDPGSGTPRIRYHYKLCTNSL